jgi:alpha-methylacyl-CoA racemase
MGSADRAPTPPLHMVGDMGGGAMFLVAGVLAALLEAKQSGLGQVVDAAICDGTTLLASMYYEMVHKEKWSAKRGSNMLDGGTPFYGCFTCADGKFISIGPLEPQFYQVLVARCGLADDTTFKAQYDLKAWPDMRVKLTQLFLTRTRDEWCALLEGSEACFAPVLEFGEAPNHPHNKAREMFFDSDGITMPAPAPRFSRTPSVPGQVVKNGSNTLEVLEQIGLTWAEIAALRDSGAIA